MNFWARFMASENVEASLSASLSLNLLEGYNHDISAVNATLSWRSETFKDSSLKLLM